MPVTACGMPSSLILNSAPALAFAPVVINANVDNLTRLTSKTPAELYGLWVSQEKMLYHNRELFKELAKKWNFSN